MRLARSATLRAERSLASSCVLSPSALRRFRYISQHDENARRPLPGDNGGGGLDGHAGTVEPEPFFGSNRHRLADLLELRGPQATRSFDSGEAESTGERPKSSLRSLAPKNRTAAAFT